MGKTLIGLVIGLLLGGIGGAFVIGPAMVGAGAGAGILTGACAAAESARGLGYLTPDQMDKVFANMPKQMGGAATPLAEGSSPSMPEACAKVLKDAAK